MQTKTYLKYKKELKVPKANIFKTNNLAKQLIKTKWKPKLL